MGKSRDALARHRNTQWGDLQQALLKTPALAPNAGRALNDMPIIDIHEMRSDYGRWNSLGLTHLEILERADCRQDTGGISVGYSTGTTGTRGIFISDARERADYLGQSLARLLPLRALFRPNRLALHLRANNSLYSDVGRRWFQFKYFDLIARAEQSLERLKAYRPTILIAPPHRLIEFAKLSAGSAPILPQLRYLFYGSDALGDAEAVYLQERFGLIPRSIYQATEGFLGATCSCGNLHLNDHSLEIELEPVEGTAGYRPIITDLRRQSQPIVRVRGDDYLELQHNKCACGFSGRIVRPPQGRISDIWNFSVNTISPPDVVRTIESVFGHAFAWNATASIAGVIIKVDPACPNDIAQNLGGYLSSKLRLTVPVTVSKADIVWDEPKRRRVSWHESVCPDHP